MKSEEREKSSMDFEDAEAMEDEGGNRVATERKLIEGCNEINKDKDLKQDFY